MLQCAAIHLFQLVVACINRNVNLDRVQVDSLSLTLCQLVALHSQVEKGTFHFKMVYYSFETFL
jgi:hypothetical protein